GRWVGMRASKDEPVRISPQLLLRSIAENNAISALPAEPAVLEVAHVLEDGVVFPDEHRLDEVADDEGRDDDFLALDMRADIRDAEGDMRVVLDEVGDLAARLVAQELDVFGMIARIGHPAAALLDPI